MPRDRLRTDRKLMINDLRDSGALEDNADDVIVLHREDAYERDSPRAGEADFIVTKFRHGPTATITVALQGPTPASSTCPRHRPALDAVRLRDDAPYGGGPAAAHESDLAKRESG
ncbi:hypothetical protein M2157_009598 [Streptomyces sp. SAI-127]|nr:hypothetical protein [Streptomyces sp. SAI-127]